MLRGENPIGADIRRVFWIRWQIIIRRCNEDNNNNNTPFPLARFLVAIGGRREGCFRVGETDRRLMKTL